MSSTWNDYIIKMGYNKKKHICSVQRNMLHEIMLDNNFFTDMNYRAQSIIERVHATGKYDVNDEQELLNNVRERWSRHKNTLLKYENKKDGRN